MKIFDRLENKLVHARRAVANAAAKKALEGVSFQDELAELERYDRLIKLLPSSERRNLRAASIIGGLCVFFAGLAWAWHIPSAHVNVTATTRVVALRLADPLQFSGSWQLDEDAGLSLANLSELRLPPEFTPHALKGPASFEVTQGRAAGVVSFFADGTKSNLAARIDLKPKDKIVLRNIKVDMLSLTRDESGTGEFASGIETGTVRIGESGDQVELTDEDQLHIARFTGLIKELQIGPGLLRISFEGRAREVSVGSVAFKRNLVPTWLAYFYHQPHPGFFWGAVVFLWSALWSARELFFK